MITTQIFQYVGIISVKKMCLEIESLYEILTADLHFPHTELCFFKLWQMMPLAFYFFCNEGSQSTKI